MGAGCVWESLMLLQCSNGQAVRPGWQGTTVMPAQTRQASLQRSEPGMLRAWTFAAPMYQPKAITPCYPVNRLCLVPAGTHVP